MREFIIKNLFKTSKLFSFQMNNTHVKYLIFSPSVKAVYSCKFCLFYVKLHVDDSLILWALHYRYSLTSSHGVIEIQQVVFVAPWGVAGHQSHLGIHFERSVLEKQTKEGRTSGTPLQPYEKWSSIGMFLRKVKIWGDRYFKYI